MALTTSKYDQENEYFGLSWDQRGASASDPITASGWTVPAPLVAVNDSFTTTTTQIKIGGGVQGATYSIINLVTVSSGQTYEAVIALKINKI